MATPKEERGVNDLARQRRQIASAVRAYARDLAKYRPNAEFTLNTLDDLAGAIGRFESPAPGRKSSFGIKPR